MKKEGRDVSTRSAYPRVWASVVVVFALGLLGLASGEGDPADSSRPEPGFRLDPNTAEPALLEVLPGLGPAKVKAIVAERQGAPFVSLDDFEERVKGIGPASAARLKPYLRFPAQTPP